MSKPPFLPLTAHTASTFFNFIIDPGGGTVFNVLQLDLPSRVSNQVGSSQNHLIMYYPP